MVRRLSPAAAHGRGREHADAVAPRCPGGSVRGALDVLADADQIRIVFSEPMVPVGLIPDGTPPPWIRMTPAAPGSFYWSGTRTLTTLDRTGLSGQFDIQLEYVLNPVSMHSGSPSPGAAPVLRAPPLEIALEEQLGLTLRRGRGRVEYLVVRSVERPRVGDN